MSKGRASSVSVVIVNYRTAALTMRAIRSALEGGVDDVVVIDNASGDEIKDRVSDLGDGRVRLLESDSNVGFGMAANRGAAVATGDVVLFLNSDAVVMPDAPALLASEIERHALRALAGPSVRYPDGRLQRSVGLLPKPADLAIRALGLHRIGVRAASLPVVGSLVRRSGVAREYAAATSPSPSDVSMISGACLAVSRERFRTLGGFDERYFMYFEDADLCRRAVANGWRLRFVPAALVEHQVAGSTGRDYHFGPLHGPSMVVYLDRWYGTAGASLAILLLLARAVGLSLAGGERARDARAALRLGVRAYRDGRSKSPMPASMPIP
jgi:GT2 family glycosyltransferase